MLEEEDGWVHNRVLSPGSAARAWEAPGAPAPDGALARYHRAPVLRPPDKWDAGVDAGLLVFKRIVAIA